MTAQEIYCSGVYQVQKAKWSERRLVPAVRLGRLLQQQLLA